LRPFDYKDKPEYLFFLAIELGAVVELDQFLEKNVKYLSYIGKFNNIVNRILTFFFGNGNFLLFNMFYNDHVYYLETDLDEYVSKLMPEQPDYENLDIYLFDLEDHGDWMEYFIENIEFQADDFLTTPHIIEGDEETAVDNYLDLDEDDSDFTLDEEFTQMETMYEVDNESLGFTYADIDYYFDDEDDFLGDDESFESADMEYMDDTIIDDEDDDDDDQRFSDELYDIFEEQTDDDVESAVLCSTSVFLGMDHGDVEEDEDTDFELSFQNDFFICSLTDPNFYKFSNFDFSNFLKILKKFISYYFNLIKYLIKYLIKLK